MKGLAFIVSIFMLLISLNPCSDGNNTEDKLVDELSIAHDHQDDTDDSCLTTCICSCCGTSISYGPTPPFSVKEYPEIIITPLYEYQSNYRFDFHSNIWQPPQLIL